MAHMKISLASRKALVCGSSQGIGWATAQCMAEAGATIVLLARNREVLEKRRSELQTPAIQHHEILVADFNNVHQLRGVLAERGMDDIDIVVNNTGGPPGGPIAEAKAEEFTKTFERHLLCNQALVQAVLPGMKERGFGRILNVISTSVKQPIAGLGVSNTIRGAVANWAKTLASEVGRYGITVNNVLPGATATARLDQIIEKKMSTTGQSREEVEAGLLASIPAARFGKPEELGYVLTFLASDCASYINGINVPVDGGRTTCL